MQRRLCVNVNVLSLSLSNATYPLLLYARVSPVQAVVVVASVAQRAERMAVDDW
jgi:hypothetical protein